LQASRALRGSTGLKMPTYTPCFRWAILTRKVGQTHLVFGVRAGFIGKFVHAMRMQDYKSLCAAAAVTICAILVITSRQTHKMSIHTDLIIRRTQPVKR